MNSPQNMPEMSRNHIQTLSRPIHSRLSLEIKPQGKQRLRNTWPAVE